MTMSNAAAELIVAVRSGDVASLRRLLNANPGLASVPPGGALGSRTPLHIVTDWPGYFPNGPEVVRILIEAGADPNARSPGKQFAETPLHWAASSDDVDVASALIDGGADLEAPGGSIGTPLANSVGYTCWHVARLLVARGAKVDALWQAASRLLGESGTNAPDAVSQAFWHACSGSQRRAAELLLAHGADLNWTPAYAKGTPLDAARGQETRQENVIGWLRSLKARSSEEPE